LVKNTLGRGKIVDGSVGLEMSSTSSPDRKWIALALAGIAGVLLALAVNVTPAAAADDDEDTFDTKFMRNVLKGLGLKRDDEAPIDYHERSPLVVPPSRDLPPPQSTAEAVNNNPAWPKDRDVARKKSSKKVTPTVQSEEDDMRQLRPDELRGAQSVRGRGVSGDQPGVNTTRAEQLPPSQLGHSGFSFDSVFNRNGKVVQFTGEPPRTDLTEPPPGLRTPSSKYPYGTKGVLEKEVNTPRDQASYGTDK